MTGGYIMIDCHGMNLLAGETSQTIVGLYATVQLAMMTGKPILAYNAKWGDIAITPIPVFALQLTATLITVTASTLQVRITNTDSVTVHNMGN